MRADELGILLFSLAFVENDLSDIEQIPNFLKLSETVRRQFVGYGHFKASLNETLLQRSLELFDMFQRDYPKAIEFFESIAETHNIKVDSPLGVIIKSVTLQLKSSSFHNVTQLFPSYLKWINDSEVNPIPLLLPPDTLFSRIDCDEILSPYISYDIPPPTPDQIESIPKDSAQSLLYHSLLHAKQRKTVLSTEEMTQFCLKLSESNDPTFLSRSSISLAQIFDIVGMKNASKLMLNESINESKQITDKSVISTAVALKAKIDDSPSSWKYAATMENPHPIASVKDALNENDFSKALKVDPTIAINVFGERDFQIAKLADLNERILPIRILGLTRKCNWKEAADLISKLDLDIIEVRATALALAVAYFRADGNDVVSNIYNEQLEDVMSIQLGHFDELKDIIKNISEEMDINNESDSVFSKINSLIEANQNMEEMMNLMNLCIKFGVYRLYEKIKDFLIHIGVEEIPEWNRPHNESLDISEVINFLMEC